MLKPSRICVVVCVKFICAAIICTPLYAHDVESLKSTAKVIVDDNFDRDAIGKAWTSNDARAQRTSKVAKNSFQSQAQIEDNVLQIRRTKGSDHASSVKTNAAFTDAIVELRFKLPPKNKFGVNVNDPSCKSVHAGHICRVEISPNFVLIQDQKTGNMANTYREARDAGESKDKLAKRIEGTMQKFATKIQPGQWHQLQILYQGDMIEVNIDGKEIGEFESEGLAHPTKANIAFAVPDAVDIDDLKVWKLK